MKRVLLCLLASLLPTAALAQSYECTRTQMARGGWVSNTFIFLLQNNGNQAQMIDAYINDVHGKPIAVDVKKVSGNRYRMKWTVRNVKVRNDGTGILSHTFIYNDAKKTFKISGRLHGFDNVISGGGTCKRR